MFALPPVTLAGFAVALLAAFVVAAFSWDALTVRAGAAQRVSMSRDLIVELQALLSTVKDAETGQRGYLVTGEARYLEPFDAARAEVGPALARLRAIDRDDKRVAALAVLVDEKMAELAETIRLRREGRADAALAIVLSDRGKVAMDRLRATVDGALREETLALESYQQAWQESIRVSAVIGIGGALTLAALIAAAAAAASRDHRARQRQEWVSAGQLALGKVLAGEPRLERQAEAALSFLAERLQARVGALYGIEGEGLHRMAAYALGATGPSTPAGGPIAPGADLLAQAVKDQRAIALRDVPAGYLPIASATGGAPSHEVRIVPIAVDGAVQGAIELGFLHRPDRTDDDLLQRSAETLAVAFRTARDRQRVQELLEETQRQAEELQAQQEELRVGNEELEEQSRALQESQASLESQQAELEQTNSQLASQADQLERQNDALVGAQTELGERAAELERSNQVKSEFLANMSHELRTPLNSSLILAKLLADNKQGNLTAEQVKFAQTISSAGNDLLALINDILDLAKLEAGKVEVVSESVSLARTAEALKKTFEPMAGERKLRFAAEVDGTAPAAIETDSQRLGQILRNLIANAIKFTDRGEVVLRIFSLDAERVAFAVRDTGVGIAADQQEPIFEAFRQADGSTHRKYGGTGLGLSISRDLARLLGGDIGVASTPGAGSTFTLTLPRRYAGPATSAARVAPPLSAPPLPLPLPFTRDAPQLPRRPVALTPPTRPAEAVDDDRDRLTPNARLILVIEDDARFAAILRDLAHEMDFQCIVAGSASEGLAAAASHRPSAILLDMNLPDHSGLGVLDQLKRNPLTRHIPVHVASVADYSREAMERGAIGYALKPVKRDDLVDALRGLEAKFLQATKRVLVVEDDARQLESITRLLEHENVRIIGVPDGQAALAELQGSTFDCMVMDLNLPDLTGDELLEAMAARDDVAFPPVIVYTGRSLTAEEEQRLRRHSKSIIVKDARSPERLLDEVTLFLHQVESQLPPERQRMLREARNRESTLEGKRVLVVEDDVRNIFALSSVLEPKGMQVAIARNGREAIEAIERAGGAIDLVLMDIMMPEMDGYTAMREIRKRPDWKKLPIIALTAKAMRDDQEKCLAAGANDYIAKPLDIEKLLSLIRVWMPK